MKELRATYRFQLQPGFGFAAVRELVPYVRELGISHLYLSPSLEARSGSTHGYDVVDPTRVREALGGEAELRALAAEGLPIILDIVPNHMGTGEQNRWWCDPQLRERWFDLDPHGGHRRFFDIDDLAAIRQEDEEVFETSHRKVLELLADGVIDGLRIDHPDGLADPAAYLRRLRERGAKRVWVEKILAVEEPLRDWPVSGTVGYEFLDDVTALFVDPAGREPLDALAAELTGEQRPFAQIALEAQLEQVHGPFERELARLARLLPRLPAETIADALARLPVYRTYVEPVQGLVEPADREAVEAAGLDPALARILLLEDRDGVPAEFITRFQQTSPAIAAKGVEDTAFYRFLRLLALNEVGGDPDRFGLELASFHARNLERAKRFPEGLLVTQTHDTKRSGDVRARIGALSARPAWWAARVRRWRELAAPLRDGPAPDGAEEYMLYQTLVGAWPIDERRLRGHLIKALRETKRNTNWITPDERWEAGVTGFAARLLADASFTAELESFCAELDTLADRHALGALLLKLTCPGVPDIYQGDELWCRSLVDPDNRRPVDWSARREALAALRDGAPATHAAAKLALIAATLRLRARRVDAFAAGAYQPLAAGESTCAFARGGEVLVLVHLRGPLAQLEPGPLAGRWRSALDGREISLDAPLALEGLLDEHGLGLYERVA